VIENKRAEIQMIKTGEKARKGVERQSRVQLTSRVSLDYEDLGPKGGKQGNNTNIVLP